MQPGDNPIEVAGSNLRDAQDGLVAAARWLGPSDSAPIMAALCGLYLVTQKPPEVQADRDDILNIMAAALSRLPADLVAAQVAAYRGVFFPKLDDIRLPIERSAAFRQRVLVVMAFREAVERITSGGAPAAPKITPEDRAKVSQGFARLRREIGGGRFT